MTVLRNILLLCCCYFPVLLMAETTSKAEPLNRVEPFSMMNMLNTVVGLVVVIGLILALAWAVKKYGNLATGGQSDMKVLSALSLGTREKAVLIQLEGQKILLGVAPGRVTALHVLDNTEKPGDEFNKNLRQAMETNE
jgi:flagellar protein FliO/FliZ